MNKLLTALLSFVLLTASAFAIAPVDVIVDSAGTIQIDDQNPRFLTGCWDSDEQAVMFYRAANRTITHAEICNEPDEEHYGLGLTAEARARNYYDFLIATRAEIAATKAPVVLGSLSGYNYQWLKEFLKLDNACNLFDVFSFHPYHLGVAPDEINIDKGAWHTVDQWVGFYRQMLKDADCEKPVWATEFGYSITGHNAEQAVTTAQRDDYALKELVMLLGLGVERASYFNKLSYVLSDSGATAWNNLVDTLVGAKFEQLELSGDQYCPRGTSCFYDENEYRLDTGESIYGLPADPFAVKKIRNYVFSRDTEKIHVSFETGKTGVSTLVSPFSDVGPTVPYATAIVGIADRGIISGYADGTFKPGSQINRAEFSKILVKAVTPSFNKNTYSKCFPDVQTEWFAPYVCYAKSQRWIGGYPDELFRPSNSVNRAEALKMATEAFDLPLGTAPGAWYMPYVNATKNAGVLNDNEAVNFGDAETRGFISELVWRGIQN